MSLWHSGPWVSLWCLICVFFRLLCEALIFPLQERLDDWKKSVIQMDKDHAKGKYFKKEKLFGKPLLTLWLKSTVESKNNNVSTYKMQIQTKVLCYLYATNVICSSCCSVSSCERKKWNKKFIHNNSVETVNFVVAHQHSWRIEGFVPYLHHLHVVLFLMVQAFAFAQY